MLRARSHFDWLDSPLGLVANSSLNSRHQALLSEEKVALSPQVVPPQNCNCFSLERTVYIEGVPMGERKHTSKFSIRADVSFFNSRSAMFFPRQMRLSEPNCGGNVNILYSYMVFDLTLPKEGYSPSFERRVLSSSNHLSGRQTSAFSPKID